MGQTTLRRDEWLRYIAARIHVPQRLAWIVSRSTVEPPAALEVRLQLKKKISTDAQGWSNSYPDTSKGSSQSTSFDDARILRQLHPQQGLRVNLSYLENPENLVHSSYEKRIPKMRESIVDYYSRLRVKKRSNLAKHPCSLARYEQDGTSSACW